MREIKFRAFDDGKMLYSHNNITNSSKFQNKWFFEKIREDAIVMQYTGLKDKEGRDIYEGDILNSPLTQNAVTFEDGTFIWCGEPLGWDLNGDDNPVVLNTNEWATVIGNIYENPELLTK